MRGFIAIALAGLLAVAGPSSAQMTLTGAGGTKPPAASGRTCTDDTASTNFLGRTSGLSNTEKDAACNLIKGLESDGIITGNLSGAAGCGTVLDALYVVATSSTGNAALNWCGTGLSLVTHGTLTFTADIGYTGDGSTGYLDTQYNPSVTTLNFSTNSGAIGAYIQSTTADSASAAMGTNAGGANFAYFVPVQSGTFFFEINAASFTQTFANTNPQGAWVISRTGASTTSAYKNGGSTPVGTGSDTSTGVGNNSWLLYALNNGGTASNFTNYQTSAFFIAAGLTSTQAVAINNRINTYMTALSHNIY